MSIEIIIFFIFAIIPPLVLSVIANRQSVGTTDFFGGKNYNKWLVALSASATAHSGFLVTTAVALGYVFGMQWMLLPLAWFLGDLVFWKYCPKKLNAYAENRGLANTTQIIAGEGKLRWLLYIVAGVTIIVLFSSYITAQWVSIDKIIAPFLGFEGNGTIWLAGGVLVAYMMIGRFRSSVYSDVYQVALMVLMSILSLVLALNLEPTALANALPDSFGSLFGTLSLPALVGFIVGWGAAAVGFDLGNPQMSDRFIAGRSPEEVAAAKWIYLIVAHMIWVGMILFGVIIRQKGFTIDVPEGGNLYVEAEGLLAVFYQAETSSIITAIIFAGIFATILSTLDSLLIAAVNVIKNSFKKIRKMSSMLDRILILILVLVTINYAISLEGQGNVFELATLAFAMLGATLAAPILIRLFNYKHSDLTVLITLISGFVIGYWWRHATFMIDGIVASSFINEAFPAIVAALLINYILARIPIFGAK